MTRSGLALLCLVLELTGAGTATAQPFGFFYGPPQTRRAYRPRRRPLPPLPQSAAIPLPPPRPHFPGDPPAAAETAAVPAPHVDAKPAGPPVIVQPKTPSRATTDISQVKPFGPAKPAAAGVAPSGAKLGEVPGQPVEDAACPGRLTARSVVVERISIGPQPDARCTVVEAVRLESLTLPDGGKVMFPEHPTVACTTADAFSLFVRDLLSPLAKGTFGAPVSAVWTGPGLECRSRDHIFGAKLSAHGQGLAIDIAQLKLGDGRMIEVGQPKSELGQGFETASRAGACGYFHTVLGPGSDEYHRTHWHFDLEVRGAHGDGKYCK